VTQLECLVRETALELRAGGPDVETSLWRIVDEARQEALREVITMVLGLRKGDTQ
jgi:hypothetical protein